MQEQTASKEHLTSREAAAQLGIAERTVLLHLKNGLLRGERRGKAWWIDGESVRAYQGQKGCPAPAPERAPSEPPVRVVPPESSAERDAAGRSYRDVPALRTLSDLARGVVRALSPGDGDPVRRSAIDAALRSVQQGAAGYHAYLAEDKIRLYAQAREQAAMAAALLWLCADGAGGSQEGLRQVAASYESAASALGGLMRKVSRFHA